MKKLALLIIFLCAISFADDNPLTTGESMISVKNNSTNKTLRFIFQTDSTVWDEDHKISSNYPGGAYTFSTGTGTIPFDLLDGNSSTWDSVKMGLGLYKVSVVNGSQTHYFYIDWRTSYLIGPNSPDIYFDYDVDNGRFTLPYSDTNINGLVETVWDNAVSGVPHQTTEFEIYLTVAADQHYAKLSWNPYKTMNSSGLYQVEKSRNGFPFGVLWESNSYTDTTFTDYDVIYGQPNPTDPVKYRIRAVVDDEVSAPGNTVRILVDAAVEKKLTQTTKADFTYRLNNNFPNPFNPSTVISYQLAENCYTSLRVLDVLGKEVVTLVNEEKAAGNYSIIFNAANLPSGVYFLSMNANQYSFTRKMILNK